jgi:hypothetical protein
VIKPTSGLPARRLYHWAVWAVLAVVLLAGCAAQSPAGAPVTGEALAGDLPTTPAPTLTPFQPLGPTRTAVPTATPTPTPAPPTATPTPLGPLAQVDLTQPVRLVIAPRADSFNRGRALSLAFQPGWPCQYSDQRACFSRQGGGQWLLASVHSGIGGDAEDLRRTLEGMGLNQAAVPLETIQRALDELSGSTVSMQQGQISADLRVLAAARIPAQQVDEYYRLPVEQAFALAAQHNPALADVLAQARPLLVLETCGWRHPADPPAPGLSDTSASIYLIFLSE